MQRRIRVGSDKMRYVIFDAIIRNEKSQRILSERELSRELSALLRLQMNC